MGFGASLIAGANFTFDRLALVTLDVRGGGSRGRGERLSRLAAS